MAKRNDREPEATNDTALEATNMKLDVAKLEQREVVRHEVETFRSFARCHGEYIIIGEAMESRPGVVGGQTLLFADGATATSTHHTQHGGREPASDLERLRNQWRYFEKRLHQEREAYSRFISECSQQVQWHNRTPTVCAPPPADWRDQAERGRARIDDLKSKLKDVLEELERTDPELIARRHRTEQRQKHDLQCQKELNDLRAAAVAVQQ